MLSRQNQIIGRQRGEKGSDLHHEYNGSCALVGTCRRLLLCADCSSSFVYPPTLCSLAFLSKYVSFIWLPCLREEGEE
jgi:hypothetical protein